MLSAPLDQETCVSRRRRPVAMLTLACALVSLASGAATISVFGPETFRRAAGPPVATTKTFQVTHPAAHYTLRVTNDGVTSGEIALNGRTVLGPADFKIAAARIDRTVTLADGLNELRVQLRSKPGSSAAVEIFSDAADTVRPTITATASPAANANGWNNTNVTVTFACADAESGIASCPAPITVTAEGASQPISGTAVDKAGNTASATIDVSIDKTAPFVAATLGSTPNASGWFASPVAVHFACVDDGSGIDTCPADQTASAQGSQTITGKATDKAGNTASATTDPIRIDSGVPSITATVSPAPNANGWNNSPVTVHFTCADPVAGVATCPADQIVSSDGLNQAITGAATDNAGNSASASVAVNIDRSPPVLTLESPANNLTLFSTPVTAAATVLDALSGITGVTCNGAPASVAESQVTCTVALTPGANTLVAIAADAAGNTTSTSLSLQYTRLPVVTIAAPANLSFFNISPTTVTGTVDDPTATVTINSIPAVVAGGTFTAALPLAEGPNVITATASTPAGGIGTTSVEVTLDTTPPHVTITSPADQFVTTEPAISIAGNINDIVVGTVNDTQAQVNVNGAAAQVANRTFLAASVPLALGPNVIQAVGRDRVGNAATTQITVVRQPPTADQHIQRISGSNQSGVIGGALGQPLVVALVDGIGAPVTNAPVIFKVTQNDGLVAADGGTAAATVIAMTGGDGRAHVNWTLGHRAGAGSNGVEAYAVGFDGTALFTASATQGAAGKIVIDTGNDQIGAIGSPLPKPFIAVVIDDGNNRLAGVPVTFTVAEGGGSIDGQHEVIVDTDSDGRAAVTLLLGMQEGNANNLVRASFPSNIGFPAAFTASGRAPGEPQKTTVSGVVLDNSNAPIPGVTVRAVLTNELHSNASVVASAVIAQTDAHGQFLIPGAPVGLVKLLVDGSTAQLPGVFPALEYDIVTVSGQDNNVGQPIYLLPLNTDNKLCVTQTTGGGTLTIPDAPGFSLTFGPGQVTFPGGSKDGCISVTVVHGDKVPMVPGFGQQPRFIVTIQPAGAVFNPPAPMTLPNVDGLRPREVTEMYSFDHDIGSFVAIGTGTVSDDGALIRTNQGVGVLKAGWHCGGNPSPTGTAATCAECQKCDGTTCVADNAASCDDGKFCTSADGKTAGSDKCDGGSCVGKKIEADVLLKVDVEPEKIIKIVEVIEKVSNMAATVTKWMPCWVGNVSPKVTLSEEKGKFCCEDDKKILDGNRLTGGGGVSISASCFVGLSSIAPELPPSIIEVLGLEAKATLGVKVQVSDVLNACTGPQWEEKGDLGLSLSVNAVIVKAGDIIGAKLEGPKGEVKVGFAGEDLFSNLHFTGSACIDGEVKMVVEHFGVGFEVKLFSLFDKVCFGE